MPERRRGRPPHPDLLTPAERRVLEELRKGGTNAEIAIRIGIGPETVKTHVSNMLAKLNLEDRRQLAAWREDDAPRPPRRWLLAPLLLRPLVALGAVAGVAVVIAVILVLLALARGEDDALNIEGVGEIEGPVAVYRNWKLEEPQQPEGEAEDRFSVFAIDLATGGRWDIYAAEGEILSAWPAGDRVVVWGDESLTIHSVSLDGESAVLLHSGDALAPHVSPDGSKIAFAVDGSPSGEPDSIIVLDVRSGDELLRIEADDPRIDATESRWSLEVTRWSVDGTALLTVGSGAGPFVLTLDGAVHDTPGRLSLDLRYGAIAPGLRSGAHSLTVVEPATGRDLFTLTPEEGRVIFEWYWGAPASGEALYGTVPPGAINERPARQAVWRVVDLDTGDTTIVSLNDEVRAEWEWLWRIQDGGSIESPWGRCLVRHQDLDPCMELFGAADEALYSLHGEPTTAEERRERDTSVRSTELLGFIWLD